MLDPGSLFHINNLKGLGTVLGPGSLYVDIKSKGVGNDASPTLDREGDLGCYIYGFANLDF